MKQTTGLQTEKQCGIWKQQAQANLMGQNAVQPRERQLFHPLSTQPAMQGKVSKHGDPSHGNNKDDDNHSSTSAMHGWVLSPLLLHHYPAEACKHGTVILLMCVSRKKVERLPNLPKIIQK